MNKTAYMQRLKEELSGIQYDEITDILSDINEYFEGAVLDGKTEADIIKQLGTPKNLAFAYRVNCDLKQNKDKKMNIAKATLTFITIGFSSLIVAPITLSILLVVFSLFVVIYCLYLTAGLFTIVPILKVLLPENIVHTMGINPFLFVPVGIIGLYISHRMNIVLSVIVRRLFKAGLQFTKYKVVGKQLPL